MAIRPLPTGDRGRPEPRRVSEGLDGLVRRLGAPSADVLTTVFNHWPELVGANVADHTTPRSLRDGTLVVAVDAPGWATQLRWLEAEVLEQVASVAGPSVVTKLEIRVVPPGPAPTPS